MKKRDVILVLVILVIIVTTSYAVASKGRLDSIDMYPLDSNSKAGGTPWGKLTLYEDGFSMTGHKLVPGQLYKLVSVDSKGPNAHVNCIQQDVAANNGNLRMNKPTYLVGMGNLAVVIHDHVDCGQGKFVVWTPENYLFSERAV